MTKAWESSFTKKDLSVWDLLLEAYFGWLLGSWGGDGQRAKRVPSHVPISSSFERCRSHWPCSCSLSQGQYSPSTAGGARHPQTAPRIPQRDRVEKGMEGGERTESRVIPAASKSVLPLVHLGIQVCCPKDVLHSGDKGTSGAWLSVLSTSQLGTLSLNEGKADKLVPGLYGS